MSEEETGRAVRLLDLILEFFTDDARWARGHYQDHGRHCLVGAVLYLSRKHHLPRERVMSLLEAALPRRQLGLIHFNDYHCGSVAELRSVIVKARALACESLEQERAAEVVKRWLVSAVERERSTRATAGDLCPRPSGETAVAAMRLAA